MLTDALPTITVTIPVLNEAAYIRQVLEAIVNQDYPVDKLEVILADGLSTDGTREIIDAFIAANGSPSSPTVTILDNPARIVSAGLNSAIQAANGEIIVRVDAHTIVSPDYIRQCVLALRQSGADGVGGAMVAHGIGYVAEAIALASSSRFGIGNSVYRTSRYFKERFVETTHMGAYRRESLLQIGLFNEQFVRHQDYELDYRIRQNGGTIFLSPAIRSQYFVRGSLRKLWRQYFQYGFWKGRLLRHELKSLRIRHAIPPLFVMALVVSLFAAIAFRPQGSILLLATLLPYLLFVLTGTILVCRGGKWRYAPLMPIVFACLHISWGGGVWIGLGLPEKMSPKRWPR